MPLLRVSEDEERGVRGDDRGRRRKEKMVAEVIKSNPFGLDSIPIYLLYLYTEINQLYSIHAFTKFILLTWWQLRN